MKTSRIYFLIVLTTVLTRAHGQGWYVEVDLDLNHGLYAFEKISSATLTFSGVTVSGSSANSNLNLVVKGTGAISGAISLSVNGTAFEPYDRNDPYNQALSIQYSGRYDVPCTTGFFRKPGSIANTELYVWVTIHPRLEITEFVQLCEEITLTTTTCSPMFQWEVSDSPTENFKALAGKSTSSVVVTRQELVNLGFANTYGRKYFRVTGLPNTTSQLQAIDIYYPGPTASIEMVPPRCHDGDDGSITLNIQSALPSTIDDFVVTLFKSEPPEGQLRQDYINDSAQKTFSQLVAGNYWVRIENNSGAYGNCWTDYHAGTLKAPDPVNIKTEVANYNGYGVRCAGANDGMINVIASGGSGTYSKFEWTPQVSTKSVASDLGAGQFHVKVSDSNGCSSETVTSIITEPKQLVIELFSTGGKNGYDVSCHNKADGKLVSEVSGGVGGYNYLWSDRNITPWISNLAAGSYNLFVSDANGCTADAMISLAAPSPIEFSIDEIVGIQCPGDKTGALEVVSVTNNIGQTTYSWSSGETSKAINNKESGTYAVTVSDEQGCSTTQSRTLSQPVVHHAEIIAISDFNGVPIRCNGTATGELRAVVRDVTGAVIAGQDFIWYRNGSLYQAGPDQETLTSLEAATYHAKILYTPHCTVEATYVLNEPETLTTKILPVSNYNGVAISCHGSTDGSLEAEALGGTGEASFLWSTGETSAVISGLPEGTYEVTVTDENGCSSHTAAMIADPEPVEVNIAIVSDYNGAAISCAGAADARLIAKAAGGTGSYHYAWSTGQTEMEAANIAAGTHYVMATDANGCTDQDASTIIAPSPVRAAIVDISDYHGYGTSCAGARDGFMRAAGSGGTGEYAYHWSGTDATTPLNASLGKGSFTVVIQDENGCSASAEASLAEPDPVTLSTSTIKNVSCYEGSDGEIELTSRGGTGSYRYSSNGIEWQSEPQLTNLKAAIYHTRVHDENGCIATHTDTLTQPSPLLIAFDDIAPALCGEAHGKVTATATGGTVGYHYRWTDAHANMVSNEAIASGLRAGLYSVTVTDAHGCQSMRTAGITSTDGPAIQVAHVSTTSCSYTTDGKALIEVTSGDGPFTFLWQNGQTTPEGVNLVKGEHVIEVRDVNNCAAVLPVMIPSPDSLSVGITSLKQPDCFGDCNGSISVLAQGGTGPYNYDWGASSGEALDNLCSGEYTVKVTDHNECIASQVFQITQPDALAIEVLTQKSPVCPEHCDGLIELEATGGVGELSYAWSNGTVGNRVSDLCADTFTAHVTDRRGCAISQTFILESPQIRPLDLGGPVTLCEGQTHTLDAGAGWKNHLWLANNGFMSESRTVALTEAAMYWLEATTSEGCIVRDTFLLQTSADLLRANFLMPSQALVGDTVVIIDISWPMPEDVVWKFPEIMTQLQSPADVAFGTFDDAGAYDISLSATLGACHDAITKTITILKEDDRAPDDGRLATEPFLKQFTLYPNPNDGMFDVVVELRDESPIVLSVWNVLTATQIARIDAATDSYHLQHIDLRPLSAGSYSLRLDYSHGRKYIRFIVR